LGSEFRVNLDGDEVPVFVRRNARAKRLTLRIDRSTGDIKLTLPLFVRSSAAERFLASHTDWIKRERAAVEPLVVVTDGSYLPYLGIQHKVQFSGISPRHVQVVDGVILVGGPADVAGKRLENWLKAEAKRLLSERAEFHADKLGVSHGRISIGDMKSRWGSCSSTGGLRFSWRLLLAPFDVLDYVAAHEVAHLREMNHSERFWAAVSETIPDYKVRRKWLKTEGNKLFNICFS